MSYYQNISIEALESIDECMAAIDKIEFKADSYSNPAAFRKGSSCELKKGAVNKIAAINRKYNKLYAEYEAEMGDMI